MAFEIGRSLRKNLNFYRVHILFFTFTPLVFSAIFYACNGRHHISYIDSLFLCVTSMTVCGLATVDLSQLTGWQQAILFILMNIGSPVAVSWFIVYLRRYYFAKKFEHIIAASGRVALSETNTDTPGRFRRLLTFLWTGFKAPPTDTKDVSELAGEFERKGSPPPKRLRPDMIRRMDDAPKRVNPSGWISGTVPTRLLNAFNPSHEINRASQNAPRPDAPPGIMKSPALKGQPFSAPSSYIRGRRLSDPGVQTRHSSPQPARIPKYDTISPEVESPSFPRTQSAAAPSFPRTQTVEFASGRPRRRTGARMDNIPSITEFPRTETRRSNYRSSIQPGSMAASSSRTYPTRLPTKHSGFGGFPMPHEIAHSVFSRLFPKLKRKLTRTVTIPATTTIASHRGDTIPPGVRTVPYISFEAVVRRNSNFPLLSTEQLEEIGGVEYRALNALQWIVACYHFGVQIFAYVIVTPYMSLDKWKPALNPPALHRSVPAPWFTLFQVVSAYTNTGTSLVDTSMIPFQRAYPLIILTAFVILAGNTAFPILLRFTIWILSKLVPKNSRANETLHFLLDHPRRCFIYLFPSHQTWFLLTVVIALNLTDWFFFMVLDIGNPTIEAIPLGVRFFAGFLQAVAVRAAGFGIVALSALAPAVKVLYVIMMYVSVYPIAMSVRSTNVYEEQSLGVFGEEEEEEDEQKFIAHGPRVAVWSRYLAMHARRQLAFDMWWIGLALFLLCIIERHHIENPENAQWFNIFSIIFELVSAYGTVGLSLGLPTANYSLSGAFRPLSKLIVCLVMIRGRHRGLPVAIDRAVMLPAEFQKPRDDESTSFTKPPSTRDDQGSYLPSENGTAEGSDIRQRSGWRNSVGREGGTPLVEEQRRRMKVTIPE